MTVINNIIELIGTSIKSIDDLVEGRDINLKYIEKLSAIEKQLLDDETREFLESLRIPPELGYFLAYQHHIERMSQSDIYDFIYEKTGQRISMSCLFKILGVSTRNYSESSYLQHHPNINFQLLEQIAPLSYRELEVFETKIQEGTDLATAEKLGITEQTVKNHLSNLYEKLDVVCFIEAVMEAYRRGILQDLRSN